MYNDKIDINSTDKSLLNQNENENNEKEIIKNKSQKSYLKETKIDSKQYRAVNNQLDIKIDSLVNS